MYELDVWENRINIDYSSRLIPNNRSSRWTPNSTDNKFGNGGFEYD